MHTEERKTKRKTACHHCRKNHKKCDGERPCQRCISKGLECYNYDSSAAKGKPRARSSSTPVKAAASSPERREEDQSFELTKQLMKRNSELLAELNRTNANENSNEVESSSRSKYSIDVWGPCTLWQKPVVMYDTSGGKSIIVGCNEAFRQLTGYSTSDLGSNQLTIFDIIPERFRGVSRDLQRWFSTSVWQTFSGCICLLFKDQTEVPVRVTNHNVQNFVISTIEVIDYFSDQWIVNDKASVETFRVENAKSVAKMLTMPLSSYKILIHLLTHGHPHQQLHQHHQQAINSLHQPQMQVERLSNKSIFGGSSSSILMELLDEHEVRELKQQLTTSATGTSTTILQQTQQQLQNPPSRQMVHQQQQFVSPTGQSQSPSHFNPVLLSTDEIEQVMYHIQPQLTQQQPFSL